MTIPGAIALAEAIAQNRELERLLEQARSIVDRLINEPRLCDECKRREEGFQ